MNGVTIVYHQNNQFVFVMNMKKNEFSLVNKHKWTCMHFLAYSHDSCQIQVNKVCCCYAGISVSKRKSHHYVRFLVLATVLANLAGYKWL